METQSTKQELVAMAQTVKQSISEMVEKALQGSQMTYFMEMTELCYSDRTRVSLVVTTMAEFEVKERFECNLRTSESMEFNMAELVGFFTTVNAALTPKPQPEIKVETQTVAAPYIIEAVENGVRVCVGDEDFIITLHDAEGEYEWHEAVDKFGDQLPTVKQAHIIGAYHDEIQAKLKDAGGDELGGWLWTCSESHANGVWLYGGTCGIVIRGGNYISIGVRPVLASNNA